MRQIPALILAGLVIFVGIQPARAAPPMRYPDGLQPEVDRRLWHDLALIGSLDYTPYFLAVNFIVRYARSKGILLQGRGSAANSAVCYVLGVTAIDDPVLRPLSTLSPIERHSIDYSGLDAATAYADEAMDRARRLLKSFELMSRIVT